MNVHIGIATVIFASANLDVLFQGKPFVLRHKTKQRLHTQAIKKHRFVLRQHPDLQELTIGIKCNQQVERCAGKPGYRRQVNRLEHITDQWGSRGILLEQWPNRQLGVFVAHDDG